MSGLFPLKSCSRVITAGHFKSLGQTQLSLRKEKLGPEVQRGGVCVGGWGWGGGAGREWRDLGRDLEREREREREEEEETGAEID